MKSRTFHVGALIALLVAIGLSEHSVASGKAERDCLRVMIPEPSDPLKLHPSTITDDDRIEFWLEEPNVAPRKGERAEKPGGRTKALIRIGDVLARYCEAPESERSRIAKQIEAEAARILSHRNVK